MQVMKESAAKLAKPSTSVLDASPVFSSRAKPRVEEVKEKVRDFLECDTFVYALLWRRKKTYVQNLKFLARCGRRVCAVQASSQV